MTEQRWYVAALKPLENWLLVTEHLERRGFEGFVPVERRRLFQAGTLVHIETPLFRGYILAKFNGDDAGQAWDVGHTQGIQYLLPRTRELPTALPSEFVDELKARPLLREIAATVRKFEKHDMVKILAGPLAGYIGKVTTSNGSNTWIKTILGNVKSATGNVARV